VNNGVEVQVEAQRDRRFAKWLLEQIRRTDRVAVPDGSCEAYEFGAVLPHPEGVVVPWGTFEDDPELAVRRLLTKRREEVAPLLLVEYVEAADAVSLRVGRMVSPARRAPGAVLLG